MKRFSPDTRGLGGKHLISRIVSTHGRTIRDIKSSCSVYVDFENNRPNSSTLNGRTKKKKVLIKRKLSTDCYEPETFSLIKKLSQNKRKRINFRLETHKNELKILRRKMSSMPYSWFSISSYIFNP
jgi:hypothetical protein